MITAIAITIVAVVAIIALVVAVGARRRRIPPHHGNGHNGGFVAWDWPPRPVNGHDHPDPPELEREPAA